MLEHLNDLQSSDEETTFTDLSFTIETRSDDGSEKVRKQYTFDHIPETGEWLFKEYEEYRSGTKFGYSDGDWRRVRHSMWSDGDSCDIAVPPCVNEELQERLSADEVVIRL